MKFLKSIFLKLKAKLTLQTYQRPLAVTLLSLFLANIAILLVGSFIAMLIDRSYYDSALFNGRFVEAFIANVKWMVSPNSLVSYNIHEHWRIMILAVILIIIGMVLFSGAIIATVTTALRTFIDQKSKAKGQILVEDHFVILNWNAKVPDMVYNLMTKGFKKNIVILSNKSKEYVESEIKSLILAKESESRYKANLIIKEGDSLLRSSLEEISIERASQICVMARDDMEEGEDANIRNADLLNLKIVLRLGSFTINPNCQIVVETDSDQTRGQIENLSYKVSSLKKLSLIPVSFNRKIGQIIAQSIVMPRISDVYDELFAYIGSEFYSIDSDLSIDEYMKVYNESIPVFKSNRMFVLAFDEKHLPKKREKAFDHFIPLTVNPNPGYTAASVFVIGENSKSEFIMENLRRNQEFGDISFNLKQYHKDENEVMIKDIKSIAGPKKVLILSDDKVGDETYDANVFVSLIELSRAFPSRENLTYITELLDSRNLSSVKDFNIKNTIISNRMMSLLLTQLVMNKESKVFFDRVLTTAHGNEKDNDFDILIDPASSLFLFDDELRFSSRAEFLRSFYEAFGHKRILLGYIRDNGKPTFLDAHQDQKEEIIIKKDDLLIYFKYFQ